MKQVTDCRVLIVEDDVLFQRVLQKRLEMDGYQVAVASDGREGMKTIVSFNPDVVVSDWMMPHVDGLELCQAIKTGLGENAPYFILVSARSEAADRARALETGADDYVVKPCDHSEVQLRVRAGLRIAGWMAEARAAERALEMARLELSALREELARRTRLLPLCESCGSIRTPQGRWEDLREYLEGLSQEEPGALCPRCSTDALRRSGGEAAAA